MTELSVSPQLYFLCTRYGIKVDKSVNVFALATKIIKVAAAEFDFHTLQLALLYLLARGYESVTASSIHILPAEYDIVYVLVYDPDDDKAAPQRASSIKSLLVPSQEFPTVVLLVFFTIEFAPHLSLRKLAEKLSHFLSPSNITVENLRNFFKIIGYRLMWDGRQPLMTPCPEEKLMYILERYLEPALKRDFPLAVAVYLAKRMRRDVEYWKKLFELTLKYAENETEEVIEREDVIKPSGEEEEEEAEREIEEEERAEVEEPDLERAVDNLLEELRKRRRA